MKVIKFSISSPQIPISILLMLSLMFIAIAKITASDNACKKVSLDSDVCIEKTIAQKPISRTSDDSRLIKLYPIYN